MFCILIFAFALVFQLLLSKEANVSKQTQFFKQQQVNKTQSVAVFVAIVNVVAGTRSVSHVKKNAQNMEISLPGTSLY